MQQYPGTFIVLEGTDGSGKTTQFKLLAERLKAVGHDVVVFNFPRYDQPSSHFVRRYLNGDYGPASSISPYSASMFFALDRYEAAPQIRQALEAGKVVLSDRYVGSNMAHQGSKFTGEAEKRGFFIWADSLEFQLLGIPRPSINIFLRVPADLSFKLIGQRSKRSYTDKARDEHEADIDHLTKSVATYDTLCQLFPKDYVAIECTNGGELMSIADISDKIWQAVQTYLPVKPARQARGGVVRLDSERTTHAKSDKTSQVSLLALLELFRTGGNRHELPKMEWAKIENDYSFYTPPELGKANREQYAKTMLSFIKARQTMQAKLDKKKSSDKADILAAITPLAAYSSPGLSPYDLKAAASVTKLSEIHGLVGASDAGDKPKKTKNTLSELVRDKLPANNSIDAEPLSLLESWPRNEFQILTDSLYGFSDLARQDVQEAVDSWTYDQKYQAMEKILSDPSANIAAQVRYHWDVIADVKLLLDLIQGGFIQNLNLQKPTPRYGYEVPENLAELGIEDEFISCFDESLKLFSSLQDSEHELMASYSVLVGHKVRFEFTNDLASLVRSKDGLPPHLAAFRQLMLEKVGEVHPLIAGVLTKKESGSPPKPPSSPTSRPKRRRRR